MNKLIAKTVVMLLLLAIGACTSSEEDTTGSIYGKVTDNKNGEVLQGVTITLTPGGLARIPWTRSTAVSGAGTESGIHNEYQIGKCVGGAGYLWRHTPYT